MPSYNEELRRQEELRSLIVPPRYAALFEIVLAAVAVILFNISELSSRFLGQTPDTIHPLSLWNQLLSKFLDDIQSHTWVQETLIFILWSAAGALMFVFIFRLIQLLSFAKESVRKNSIYIDPDPRHGRLQRQMGSLHNILVRLLVGFVATVIFALAILVCFGIASQELENSLGSAFPANLGYLMISAAGAILSVRLVIIGLSLISQRFRNWYGS
jgi:hypothetical protein